MPVSTAAATGRPGRLRSYVASMSTEWTIILTPLVAILWLGCILGLVIYDQISDLPPRPPSPAEVARASPVARTTWRVVYGRLQQRLPQWQPHPPELGAVWSTRNGQICGLVDEWHTGVDDMTPFYTIGQQPFFKEENLRLYVQQWSKCIMDPWVVLHQGSLDEGACASRTGRSQFCRR